MHSFPGGLLSCALGRAPTAEASLSVGERVSGYGLGAVSSLLAGGGPSSSGALPSQVSLACPCFLTTSAGAFWGPIFLAMAEATY